MTQFQESIKSDLSASDLSALKVKLDAYGVKHFGVLPEGWDGASADLIRALKNGEYTGGFFLAVVGRDNFGNPIPQEWYGAGNEFRQALMLSAMGLDMAYDAQEVTWSQGHAAVGIAKNGVKVAVRFGNEVSSVADVWERLNAGEKGDDLPIVMEAFGCDYDRAFDAVFLGNFTAAKDMLIEAVRPVGVDLVANRENPVRPRP